MPGLFPDHGRCEDSSVSLFMAGEDPTVFLHHISFIRWQADGCVGCLCTVVVVTRSLMKLGHSGLSGLPLSSPLDTVSVGLRAHMAALF